MIYVLVDNPAEIYGRWPDHDYLPMFVPPPPNFYSAGIGFSIGFGVTGALWGWGYPDWRQHEVVVDPKRYSSITTSTDITGNHIAIENNTWNRTAAITIFPSRRDRIRPRPPTKHGNRKRAGNREATFGERPSARQPHKKSNIPTGFREPPAEIAADRTSSEHQDAPLSVSPAGGRFTEYNPTQH